MSPWLSVITVVKDDVDGVERTFESLAGQDLDSTQLVVIDGSADRESVLRIIDGFPDSVDYEWCEPEGIYAAMNRGLTRARGEFTYFANAGDSLFGDSVFGYVCELVEGFDWAFGPVEIIESDGRRVFSPAWDYDVERAANFSRGHFPSHQGTFARTELMRELGGFDESYRIAADYAMALALSRISDPVQLPFVVASFYEGGASTRGWSQAVREFHRARSEILDPRGVNRVRENVATGVTWASSWMVREVRPRLKGAAR